MSNEFKAMDMNLEDIEEKGIFSKIGSSIRNRPGEAEAIAKLNKKSELIQSGKLSKKPPVEETITIKPGYTETPLFRHLNKGMDVDKSEDIGEFLNKGFK